MWERGALRTEKIFAFDFFPNTRSLSNEVVVTPSPTTHILDFTPSLEVQLVHIYDYIVFCRKFEVESINARIFSWKFLSTSHFPRQSSNQFCEECDLRGKPFDVVSSASNSVVLTLKSVSIRPKSTVCYN